MTKTNAGTAIVTGGNRGIGLEVCRQLADLNYTVILGSRDLGNIRLIPRRRQIFTRKLNHMFS